jgi:hypothetical protein
MPRRSQKQPARTRPVARKARVAKRRPRARPGMPAPRAFGAGLGRGAMAPAAVSASWSLGRARFVAPAKGGCMRICHSEFLTNLSGATTFTAVSVPLNPGLSSTFVWLAALANNFESYHFHSLRAVYRTMKGTSTSGEVILAIDYDAADGLPTSKASMFSYEGVVKSAPWENVAYVSSGRNLSKAVELYTRSGLVAGTDIKTYDVGNLILAVDACADTSIVGDVFLEYDVEFFTPQSSPECYCTLAQKIETSNSPPAALFTSSTVSTGNSIASPTVGTSTLVFNVPGEYLLSCFFGAAIDDTAGLVLGGSVTASITTPSVVHHNQDSSFDVIVRAAAVGQTLELICVEGPTGTLPTTFRLSPYTYALA